jgi:3-oxosteroid 1-dehydrogenase
MTEPDVVVLGSGAAGLTGALAAAANGATVEVFEAAGSLGGTTAVSGGIVWVPAHHRLRDRAMPVDDAIIYLRTLSRGSMDEEWVERVVCSGSEMLEFVETRTPLRFSSLPAYPDDEPDLPGGRSSGRSFIAAPFEPEGLDGWLNKLTSFPPPWGGIGFDVRTGSKLGGRGGATLVLGLLQGLLRLGVVPCLNHRAERLLVRDGSVVGVRVAGPDGPRTVRARRGVILATGGFEWSPELVRAFLRGPMHGATSPPGAYGDGLRMAMSAGAELGNMAEAWWDPYVAIPLADSSVINRGFIFERTRPRSIMVNRRGSRFVNEASAFNAMAGAFHQLTPREGYANDPAWLVFDAVHQRQYGGLGAAAGEPAPNWLIRADDLAALAARAGIDPAGLARTVSDWNRHVAAGVDPEFGRGRQVHGAWSGDEDAATIAERTLGPIDSPPFYATPVTIGAIGTKGGPRTDPDGRVRHVLGGTIPGLYAAGNAASVPIGNCYGGPGSPIGMAMVSGYLAGRAVSIAD